MIFAYIILKVRHHLACAEKGSNMLFTVDKKILNSTNYGSNKQKC